MVSDWLAAGGELRFSEARLTGFPHVKPGVSSPEPTRQRLRLQVEIEEAARAEPTAEALHALAILRLVHGQITEGVALLERSLELEPSNAGAWNDLAAAYHERSRRDREPYFLTRSLSAALRAQGLDPRLSEAVFNLALGYRELGLVAAARSTWKTALELETDAGFRKEAADGWAEAKRPTLQDRWSDLRATLSSGRVGSAGFPDALAPWLREWAMLEALPRWGGSPEGAGNDGPRALGAIRRVGEWLQTHARSGEVAEAVQEIGRDSRLRPELAAAFRAFGEARVDSDRLDYEAAREKLTRAAATFGQWLPAWSGWCDEGLAVIEISESPAAAKRRALAALQRADCGLSAALCGRLHWAVGLVALRSGRLTEALTRFELAGRLFDDSHESIFRGAIEGLLAETWVALGRPRESWKHRREGLRRLSDAPGSYRLHNLLLDCSLALAADRQIDLALRLQDQGVEVARRTREPETLAEALQWRAKIHVLRSDLRSALADLKAAERAAQDVENVAFRQQLEWDLAVAMAETLGPIDPEAAIGRLDGVVEGYRGRDLELDAIRALLVGLRIEKARGRLASARGLLEDAVRSFEEQNGRIDDPLVRLDHYRGAPGLYDELILLEADRNRPEGSFFAADRKLRALFEAPAAAPPDAAASLEAWRGRIPAGTLVALYAVTPERLFVGALSRDRIVHAFREIPAEPLRRRVRAAVKLLRGVGPAFGSGDPLAELYADLVGPIEDLLEGKRTLLVAVDGVLRELPFAALRRSPSDPPLIARMAVAKIPSVGSFLDGGRKFTKFAGEPALVVGDPAFDVQRLRWVARLPGAAEEAAGVAKLYGRSARWISDRRATRSAVLAGLPTAGVFHFAGHALGVGGMQLLTASAENEEDAISAIDIYPLDLGRLRVAVLSACSTGAGEDRPGEGVYGFAHPFVVAGAGAVVATLWRIPDRPARDLAVAFHQGLRTLSPVEALRQAQLKAIRPGAPPPGALWAAFDLIAADPRALD